MDMISVSTIGDDGYENIQLLYRWKDEALFSGVQTESKNQVFLKYYKSLSSAALQELTNRFNVFKNISSPYQANVEDLIEITRKEAEDRILTFEASGDPSLKQYLSKHKLSIENILKIGIQLSEAVADLHEAGIIYAGLRPSSIAINPENQNIKINDVGLLSGDNFFDEDVYQQDMVNDVLPYISPEQSGRTSNIIDHRTDLYSIGIILYECLTGRRPFITDDPLKLIHAHLAQDPPELSKIDKTIPSTISKIIQRLLSKAPEDRYTGAWGLKTDLKRCRMQWQDSGYISEFDLAQVDVPHILKTSQKLFGREAELEILLGIFERANRGGRALTLIKGASGIGKSILVNEFKNRSLKSSEGYFISGKFSQMKRNIPYEALIQALDGMIGQILSESEEQIEDWKNKLQNALSPNGQVVIDVLPELELIIGEQPEIPKLGTVESQNRFNFVLGNFITALAAEDKPLILFIDDLQWADSSSLQVLEVFMAIDAQYLLILGAFRDNEVDATHQLSLALERIQNAGGSINEIKLHPLKHQDVNQLLSEIILCNPENTKELARVCVEKTHGNPFFLNQFIKSLHRQHLLSFDAKQESWKWSVDKIRKNQVTDNVVEYMAAEINRLSSQTQTAMKLAACLGNEFELGTFSFAIKKSSEEALAYLKEALDKELILSKKGPDTSNEMFFRFSHDRVHQAAYSLTDKDQKAKLHLKIGRLLFDTTPEEQIEERIFNIVYQLNNGSKLIETIKEKEDLAKLNLVAANKARVSAAFGPSFDYLMTGMRLLEKECWENQYELTLSLYETAAETAYLNGHFDKTHDFANVVIKRAHKIWDTLRVYEAKIRAYAMANNFPESVKTGLEILKKLGVNFPTKPTDVHLFTIFIRIKMASIGKNHRDIITLPDVKDPKIIAIMRLLRPLAISAYLSDPKLMVLIILKGSHLMMKYGHDPVALFTDMYGLGLCLFGEIEAGYQYAKAGLKLVEKYDARAIEAHILVNFNAFIRHWKEHIKNNLSPLLDAYNKSIETGNLEMAGYASLMYCINSYFCGRHLDTLASESRKYGRFMKQIKQDTTFRHNQILHQALLNLMGENENPIYLIGNQYDETEMLTIHLESKDESALFDMHFHKMMLCFLFDEYQKAVKNSETAIKYQEVVLSQPEMPILHFYDSLIQLAVVSNKPRSERRVILRRVAKNQKKMKKWSHHAPMNCLHKYLLVEAERYRVIGKNEDAAHHYDKAITKARENEYIQEQALANELAGKFYMTQNKDTIAGAYLLKAHECYLKWGAHAKVKQLEKKFSQYFNPLTRHINEKHKDIDRDELTGESGGGIDLATVIQAVKTISAEKDPGRLLGRLMEISVENAGARKGYLILKKEGQFIVETSISANREYAAGYPTTLEECNEFCLPVINYTIRTGNDVLLSNAEKQGQFIGDPYIKNNSIKSILCTPISDKDCMTGILYLENRHVVGAFTPERVKIIRTVSEILANAWARLEAEENILKHRSQLQKLSSQMLLTEERERRRIAVDLHDRIGHALSDIMLRLGIFKQSATDLESKGKINDVSEIVEQCIEDTHSLTFDISPPILYDLGLEAALDWLAEQTQIKHNINIQFEDDEQEKPLDESSRVLLFQASRELLFNMVKHSQAKTANVSIGLFNQHVRIVIKDDGIGFEPDSKRNYENKKGGFGLFSIQERLAQQGGMITIESIPGEGTCITMEMPMETVKQKVPN